MAETKYNSEPRFVLYVNWGRYNPEDPNQEEGVPSEDLVHRYSTFEDRAGGAAPFVYNTVKSFSGYEDRVGIGGFGGTKSIEVEIFDQFGFFYQLYHYHPMYLRNILCKLLLVYDTSIYNSPTLRLDEPSEGCYTGDWNAVPADKISQILYDGEEILFSGQFIDPIYYDIDNKIFGATVSTITRSENICYTPDARDVSFYKNGEDISQGYADSLTNIYDAAWIHAIMEANKSTKSWPQLFGTIRMYEAPKVTGHVQFKMEDDIVFAPGLVSANGLDACNATYLESDALTNLLLDDDHIGYCVGAPADASIESVRASIGYWPTIISGSSANGFYNLLVEGWFESAGSRLLYCFFNDHVTQRWYTELECARTNILDTFPEEAGNFPAANICISLDGKYFTDEAWGDHFLPWLQGMSLILQTTASRYATGGDGSGRISATCLKQIGRNCILDVVGSYDVTLVEAAGACFELGEVPIISAGSSILLSNNDYRDIKITRAYIIDTKYDADIASGSYGVYAATEDGFVPIPKLAFEPLPAGGNTVNPTSGVNTDFATCTWRTTGTFSGDFSLFDDTVDRLLWQPVETTGRGHGPLTYLLARRGGLLRFLPHIVGNKNKAGGDGSILVCAGSPINTELRAINYLTQTFGQVYQGRESTGEKPVLEGFETIGPKHKYPKYLGSDWVWPSGVDSTQYYADDEVFQFDGYMIYGQPTYGRENYINCVLTETNWTLEDFVTKIAEEKARGIREVNLGDKFAIELVDLLDVTDWKTKTIKGEGGPAFAFTSDFLTEEPLLLQMSPLDELQTEMLFRVHTQDYSIPPYLITKSKNHTYFSKKGKWNKNEPYDYIAFGGLSSHAFMNRLVNEKAQPHHYLSFTAYALGEYWDKISKETKRVRDVQLYDFVTVETQATTYNPYLPTRADIGIPYTSPLNNELTGIRETPPTVSGEKNKGLMIGRVIEIEKRGEEGLINFVIQVVPLTPELKYRTPLNPCRTGYYSRKPYLYTLAVGHYWRGYS